MKKIFFLVIALVCLNAINADAQYRTAIGGKFYAGNGNLGGISLKHFVKSNAAIEGNLLFGTKIIGPEFLYNWHGRIPGAEGLKYFVGGGGALLIYTGGGSNSAFALRADIGLDYKFTGTPIDVSVGLDPFFFVTSPSSTVFTVGLAFRYVLK